MEMDLADSEKKQAIIGFYLTKYRKRVSYMFDNACTIILKNASRSRRI